MPKLISDHQPLPLQRVKQSLTEGQELGFESQLKDSSPLKQRSVSTGFQETVAHTLPLSLAPESPRTVMMAAQINRSNVPKNQFYVRIFLVYYPLTVPKEVGHCIHMLLNNSLFNNSSLSF